MVALSDLSVLHYFSFIQISPVDRHYDFTHAIAISSLDTRKYRKQASALMVPEDPPRLNDFLSSESLILNDSVAALTSPLTR